MFTTKMTGNGFYILPTKTVMTGGWFKFMTLFYPHYPKLMAINIYLLNGHHDLDDFGYRYFRKTTFFL